MKRAAIITLLLAVLVLGTGCASSRGRFRPFLSGGGYGGATVAEMSVADELAAKYGITFWGVRFLNARPAVRVFYWDFLPIPWIQTHGQPVVHPWPVRNRIRDQQEDLGRLDIPAEAPN